MHRGGYAECGAPCPCWGVGVEHADRVAGDDELACCEAEAIEGCAVGERAGVVGWVERACDVSADGRRGGGEVGGDPGVVVGGGVDGGCAC